jgi:cell volume regulation protein A
VAATLEIESGSNDPMAVFMTVALIELLLAGRTAIGADMALAFIQQMGIGAAVGVAGGLLLPRVVNRLNLAEGLYPLLALAGGLTVFGATMVAGGSGYLAIYLTGLMLGNHRLHSARNILRVHDGLAWLAQIAMFLMLGLLVTPSALLADAWAALAIAVVLIVIARPAAVWLCLLPFRWPWREKAYIAWVGLRGAVPIILAVFPVLAGVPGAETYFNIAFFVVLVSLVLQGWTVAPLARGFGLELPHDTEPARRIDVELPAGPDFELLTYTLTRDCPATRLRMAALPPAIRARVVGVFRGRQALRPDDMAELQEGDDLVLLAPADEVEALNRWLTPHTSDERVAERQLFGDFTLESGARLADLASVYGLELEPGLEELTAEQLIRQRFRERPTVGDRVALDRMELVVREMVDDRIVKVGLVFASRDPKGRKGRA